MFPTQVRKVAAFGPFAAVRLGAWNWLSLRQRVCGAALPRVRKLARADAAQSKSDAPQTFVSDDRKQGVRGKSGPSYTLRVRSWRAGRATEDLGVEARTYRR